ncbi:MAG: hypothetical protein AAGB93_06550 [Planctomycetota bacterium]
MAAGFLACAACRGVAGGVEIPEPMVFDLVRGLGAARGEVEANALAVVPLDGDDPAASEVAPEVEVAVEDGLAVELEFPVLEGSLFSLKTAAQWTFDVDEERGVAQGVQGIVERLLEEDAWHLTLLWVPGVRFDKRWSALALVGVGAYVGGDVRDEVGLVANVTGFCDLAPAWTLGLEVDTEVFAEAGWSTLLMPQVQWESGGAWTVQAGAGALYVDGSVTAGSDLVVPETEGWFPQVAVRLIAEW